MGQYGIQDKNNQLPELEAKIMCVHTSTSVLTRKTFRMLEHVNSIWVFSLD